MVQNPHSQNKKKKKKNGGGLCVLREEGGGAREVYGGVDVVATTTTTTSNTTTQKKPLVLRNGGVNELLLDETTTSTIKWTNFLLLNNPSFDDDEYGNNNQHHKQKKQLPPNHPPFQDFIKCSREVGEFLSGALAGAMTKAVLAPLETIRTRMVVGVGSRSIPGSFIEVVEKQGWQGLWAGNAINMLRIIPTQAIELGTFECVKRSMTTAQEKWITEQPSVQIGHVNLKFSLSWLSPIAVAGAAAGFVSTLVCHPLEVLKDRLTVSPEAYPSLAIAVSKIYKDSGVGGFYSGLFPTVIGMLPYSTCYYFMYETMKNSYCVSKKKKALNRGEMLLLGALSGFTASTISFPLEVARKRLMVGALKGKCPPNMVAALAEVLRDEGLLGLYRGWGASCLKVMPSSGITWMFYEAWKDILLAERRHL